MSAHRAAAPVKKLKLIIFRIKRAILKLLKIRSLRLRNILSRLMARLIVELASDSYKRIVRVES